MSSAKPTTSSWKMSSLSPPPRILMSPCLLFKTLYGDLYMLTGPPVGFM
eukprot:CAMPEP_0204504290 /NCGR_PEP_ID=MMETSP0471-20130131/105183_1 /ASSEMBLY_ACC=CAM_ASM_000602 /TAXON_ID=2969 /ORGANISM="Oxyrrhis marina" /LENGTH=48 /DNA_ID= /DNA_START= /DNA_END= /DNA_ORIENTATION=